MQREEKAQDAVLEAIISRVNDLKSAIGGLIFKVENEYETLNWPSFLDNFALISGHVRAKPHLKSTGANKISITLQLTTLTKILSNDKAPALRNFTVLPLMLKPDVDENLNRMTEGRLNTFSHDIVPDYLRTKPEPDAELKMMQFEHKASCVTYETAQVRKMPKFNSPTHILNLFFLAETSDRDEQSGRARVGHGEQGKGGVGERSRFEGGRCANLVHFGHTLSSGRHRPGQGTEAHCAASGHDGRTAYRTTERPWRAGPSARSSWSK